MTSSLISSPWKNTFSEIIWDDLLISVVNLKLWLTFWHFLNGCHFEVVTKLFYQKWYWKLNMLVTKPLAFPTFWVFDRCYSWNITRDMAVQNFGLFWDLITSSVMSLNINYTNVVIIQWYSKFNDDIFVRFLVIMKNVLISFIKGYKGLVWRPTCDIIHDFITTKNTFSDIIWEIFSYLRSNWSCIWYFYIFKMAAILSSQQTFLLEVILEVEYASN